MADLENMIDDNLRNLLKVFLKMEITSFSPSMFIKPSPPLKYEWIFFFRFLFFHENHAGFRGRNSPIFNISSKSLIFKYKYINIY